MLAYSLRGSWIRRGGVRRGPGAASVKKFVLVLLVVLIVAVALAGFYFVRSARSFEQMVAFGRQTQARYQQLNTEIQWERPASRTGQVDANGGASWDSYLRVRDRLVAAIPPELDRQAQRVLETEDPGLFDQVSLLLSLEPYLRQPVDMHLDALAEERMNPAEYRWLTGVALRSALQAGPDGGGDYRRLIERLVVYSRRFVERAAVLDPAAIPDADFVEQTIEREFGGWPPPPPEVLESLMQSRDSAKLIDLFLIALEPEEWASAAGTLDEAAAEGTDR